MYALRTRRALPKLLLALVLSCALLGGAGARLVAPASPLSPLAPAVAHADETWCPECP